MNFIKTYLQNLTLLVALISCLPVKATMVVPRQQALELQQQRKQQGAAGALALQRRMEEVDRTDKENERKIVNYVDTRHTLDTINRNLITRGQSLEQNFTRRFAEQHQGLLTTMHNAVISLNRIAENFLAFHNVFLAKQETLQKQLERQLDLFGQKDLRIQLQLQHLADLKEQEDQLYLAYQNYIMLPIFTQDSKLTNWFNTLQQQQDALNVKIYELEKQVELNVTGGHVAPPPSPAATAPQSPTDSVKSINFTEENDDDDVLLSPLTPSASARLPTETSLAQKGTPLLPIPLSASTTPEPEDPPRIDNPLEELNQNQSQSQGVPTRAPAPTRVKSRASQRRTKRTQGPRPVRIASSSPGLVKTPSFSATDSSDDNDSSDGSSSAAGTPRAPKRGLADFVRPAVEQHHNRYGNWQTLSPADRFAGAAQQVVEAHRVAPRAATSRPTPQETTTTASQRNYFDTPPSPFSPVQRPVSPEPSRRGQSPTTRQPERFNPATSARFPLSASATPSPVRAASHQPYVTVGAHRREQAVTQQQTQRPTVGSFQLPQRGSVAPFTRGTDRPQSPQPQFYPYGTAPRLHDGLQPFYKGGPLRRTPSTRYATAPQPQDLSRQQSNWGLNWDTATWHTQSPRHKR